MYAEHNFQPMEWQEEPGDIRAELRYRAVTNVDVAHAAGCDAVYVSQLLWRRRGIEGPVARRVFRVVTAILLHPAPPTTWRRQKRALLAQIAQEVGGDAGRN